MGTKIYVLVAYTSDDQIIDLGYAEDLKMVQDAVTSNDVAEQLEELGVKDVEKFVIRDNYYPTNYYPLGENHAN